MNSLRRLLQTIRRSLPTRATTSRQVNKSLRRTISTASSELYRLPRRDQLIIAPSEQVALTRTTSAPDDGGPSDKDVAGVHGGDAPPATASLRQSQDGGKTAPASSELSPRPGPPRLVTQRPTCPVHHSRMNRFSRKECTTASRR